MKNFNCKNCGAVLYWNPSSNSLECEYCGEKFSPSDFENEEEIQQSHTDTKEPETADENVEATDASDSQDLVVYKCNNCGAEIVTARSTISTTCAYCGEALSITNKLVDKFKPDLVIPFRVTKEEAMELYKKYTKKGILTPKNFYSSNVIEKTKGVYIPFWLHSFTNDAQTVVATQKISSSRRGYDKIDKIDIYEIDINSSGDFKYIPTDALKNVDNTLMDTVEPFDYSAITDFSPAYMTGFYAEEYNEDENTTFPRAKTKADEAMQNKILSSVMGYSSKSIKTHNSTCENTEHKYTMLPVWLFSVKYQGQNYLYAVNGQTGKVAGKLPKSMKKLFLFSGIGFAGVQLVSLLIRLLAALF